MKKRNFLNLWNFGLHKRVAKLERSIVSMPESPERLEVLFQGLKIMVEQNFSFSNLDQYPRLLLATLEAGQDLMRLGSRGVSQYFWLGIFFEAKWPVQKRQVAFYQLLLSIMKRIRERVWIWGDRLKRKLAELLWQHAPADFLAYRTFIQVEGVGSTSQTWAGS